MTPVTVKKVRTACVLQFPHMSMPAQQQESTSVAGGKPSVVSKTLSILEKRNTGSNNKFIWTCSLSTAAVSTGMILHSKHRTICLLLLDMMCQCSLKHIVFLVRGFSRQQDWTLLFLDWPHIPIFNSIQFYIVSAKSQQESPQVLFIVR